MTAKINIREDKYSGIINFDYTTNTKATDINISGELYPYNSGRCINYRVDNPSFEDIESEAYFGENFEDIENEIITKYFER